MKAYILITVHVGMVRAIADKLRDHDIANVAAVAGVYDLVVTIDADDLKKIGDIVLDIIQQEEGVTSSVTLIQID